MKQAVFEIKLNPVGRYYFVFRDVEETGLVVSKSFRSRAQLEKCLSAVRDTAQVAEITEDANGKLPPYFWIENNEENFVFSLLDFEGEVVFSSESYQQKSECLKAVRLLKDLSFDAGIVDSV
jgi:uncharacterized protein YegP (UPF0339 family)